MGRGRRSLEIEPEHILLTSGGQARLRVRGRGFGWLRVGARRRWVWGDFDESVPVSPSKDSSSIEVSLRGVGGGERAEVPLRGGANLAPPVAPRPIPLRSSNVRAPRAPRLAIRRYRLPRVRRLERVGHVLHEGKDQ